MNETIWNLQLLADAGTLINGTTNFPNAYDSSQSASFDSAHTLANELKTFYDTELLENARHAMVDAQFGKKQNLPRNRGKTVEWRKWNTFPTASQLTEGVIPTGEKFGSSYITGSINQYGLYTGVTDRLELHAYDDVILGAAEEMGASMALTQELLIRTALLSVANVLYCDNLKADGSYLNTPTSCATMGQGGVTAGQGGAADTPHGYAYLTGAMISKAVALMKRAQAPMIDGSYVCVIHPSVTRDLRNDPSWIEAHKYAAPEEIFNGEVGKLHGVRFLESLFPCMTDSGYRNMEYSTTSGSENNGATYACFLFGKDAFGIIDPEGGAAQMIVKSKDQIGGPLEQFSTVGYKLETNGATVLYPERVMRIMCTSSLSATDEQVK